MPPPRPSPSDGVAIIRHDICVPCTVCDQVALTRTTLSLFTALYASDIILASPLGLRMAAEGDEKHRPDHDFLSSIEVCIVDQVALVCCTVPAYPCVCCVCVRVRVCV